MKDQKKILIVDDELMNRDLLEAMLLPLGYEIYMAGDGLEALEIVEKELPDLILLDVMMPKMDGFELTGRLKSNEETKNIPIIMITALNDVNDRVTALELGADDFLSKPIKRIELRARVNSILQVKAYHDHLRNHEKELKSQVAKRTEELKHAYDEIRKTSLEAVYRLSRAAEYRDEDTGAHILRMSNYSAILGRTMGLDEEEVASLLYAAPMHDIGKIGIPDKILLKPGKLDAIEWSIMMQHTAIGAKILEGSNSPYIQLGEIIALSHHERWDGKGYPRNLMGKDIPLTGRIVAVADVFDALTSKRPYKEPFSLEKTYEILKADRGTHFDPDVVDAFFCSEKEILTIKMDYKDEGESPLLTICQIDNNR